jgi:hypothetical protein
MLESCVAHLVARGDAQLHTLERIGARAGFGTLQPLGAGHDGLPGLQLNYFLVHHELGAETLETLLRSVRASSIDAIRYAPVVLFAADGPFEQYLGYIDMGFDDIITLPENAAIVEQRLIAQLDAEHMYLETASYFGPDRRRMEIEPPVQFKRQDSPHSHVRHYFWRSPSRGIVVDHSDSYLGVGHHPLRVERVG